jgi:hypothetical protein
MMPANLSAKDLLSFRLIQPEYISEPLEYRRTLPIDELRKMTSVMVMEAGIALSGRIVDSRGLPVVDARVFLPVGGYTVDPASLTPEQADCLLTETDSDGRYRFGHLEPGDREVIVEARGYVRQNARVVVGPKSAPAEIRLTSVKELEEAARVARLGFERMLAADEKAGPHDIPPEWLIIGVLIGAAVVVVARLILWLWRKARWGQ